MELKQRIIKNKLFEYFNQSFKLDIYQNWNLVLSKFLKNKEELITKSHSKKLRNLGIVEKLNTRIKVYNLSSKNLDENLTKILEKGPKYVFPTRKYNELDDQIEAEYLYYQISEISKTHSCNELNFENSRRILKFYVNHILVKTKNGTIKTVNWKLLKTLQRNKD